jgi:peptide/nickel transport system substrate-binding protein
MIVDSIHMLKRAGALLAVFATVAGCTENTGQTGAPAETDGAARTMATSIVDDATGPAAPVPGAKPGGTITVLYLADFEHLDPAQNYITHQQVAANVFMRTLTAFREHGDGTFDVVGDLATNTGTTTDGGLTWTYTLRDGIKFEDGRPITSRDIAYGVARTFSPDLPNGPHYLQQWLVDDLDYNKVYKGPYNGGAPIPPGVETPDDKTIVFRFAKPRPDMPFAAALPTTTPVPMDKDTRAEYDNRPFASGPYKIDSYQRGQSLVMVKNEHWDPNTDPLRHQYPDTMRFEFGASGVQINERLVASQGPDAAAISWAVVAPEVLPKVLGDSAVMSRVIQGLTQFNRYLAINMQRVPDLAVRQAMNYAIDRENFLKVYSPVGAVVGTTILSPTTLGYQHYNAYDAGPTGDTAKARELLGGRRVALTYAYPNSPRQQRIAAFLQTNLNAAGFDVTIQAVDFDQYVTSTARKDNPFDFYQQGWGSDWPSGATIIPPLFDGRTITPAGNQNNSFINEPEINARIDSISLITDLAEAGRQWAALDRDIMTKYAPVVPLTYEKNFSLIGTRVGGAFLSAPYGLPALTNIFVK